MLATTPAALPDREQGAADVRIALTFDPTDPLRLVMVDTVPESLDHDHYLTLVEDAAQRLLCYAHEYRAARLADESGLVGYSVAGRAYCLPCFWRAFVQLPGGVRRGGGECIGNVHALYAVNGGAITCALCDEVRP